jgi:hypothetical protein
MEILEIGKLEAYINVGQEARATIAYKVLKAGDNGCRREARGRKVRGDLVRGCRGSVALLRRRCSAMLRQNKLGD